MAKYLYSILTLAGVLASAAQEPSATPSVGERAVSTVLRQSAINPTQYVEGTKAPLSSKGKWSIAKEPAEGCAPSTACIRTFYKVVESNIACEWTVQLSNDDVAGGLIVDEDENAEKYLVRRLQPDEATALVDSSELAIYPPIARAAHVGGQVGVSLTVSRDGIPTSAVAISGPAMLQGAALDAARKWRFKPLLLHGRPIAWASTQLTFTFALGASSPGVIPTGSVKAAFVIAK
jgi:TonB family protein